MVAQAEPDVLVIGGGAAGIAAARHLQAAGVAVTLVEARARLGGRAHSVIAAGEAVDLGCGWLHSAPDNEWVVIAANAGLAINRASPPWQKPPLPASFAPKDLRDFQDAMTAFWSRMEEAGARGEDDAADTLLEPGNRWNGLLDAISTYINGCDLSELSILDFANYVDTEINWRVPAGFGTLIAAHAPDVPTVLDCPVHLIDHSGPRIRVETAKGTFSAKAIIITVPSDVLSSESIAFTPDLPDKIGAAHQLPLGANAKLFLALEGAEEFEPDTRLFADTSCVRTGNYALRPMGRAMIEGYFGGELARDMEAEGLAGFADFAIGEITKILGSDFGKRITPLACSSWTQDPFARGAYSHARIGYADARAYLAEPVENRIFFAGEACSTHDFSTAHGAYRTGIAAAKAYLGT